MRHCFFLKKVIFIFALVSFSLIPAYMANATLGSAATDSAVGGNLGSSGNFIRPDRVENDSNPRPERRKTEVPALPSGASGILNPNSSSISSGMPLPSLPSGGNGLLGQVFSAAGSQGDFMTILANALGSFLTGMLGTGGADSGGLTSGLSSMFSSVMSSGNGGNDAFGGALQSFASAAGSNNAIEQLLNGGMDLASAANIPSLENFQLPPVDPSQAFATLDQQEYYCWVKTCHSEARGESFAGKVAVAHVINNRVKLDKDWMGGDTVCGVTHKATKTKSGKVVEQFTGINSYVPDRTSASGKQAWQECKEAVAYVLAGGEDITQGSDHFVNLDKASPKWANTLAYVDKIGGHTFYKSQASA